MSVHTLVLSLAASLFYGVTSVLQQSAAADVSHHRSMRPGLILELARRPRWLLGNLAEVAAVALHFLALRHGSLLLVQTVLVTGMLFALPLAAAWTRRRLSKTDWLAAIAVVVGLGMFLAVASPSRGRGEASGWGWVVVLGLGGAVVGGLVFGAPREAGPARATYLGAACGVIFGVDAALTKAAGHLLNHGVLHALGSWEPYLWAICAAFGFLLAQSAFQAGQLGASLPVLTIADPVVAAAIGAFAFREHIASDPVSVVVEAASVVAMVAGTWVLARSPLVSSAHSPPHVLG